MDAADLFPVTFEALPGSCARLTHAGLSGTVQPNPRADVAAAIARGVPPDDARAACAQQDAFTYTTPRGETFSHPTFEGACHMVRKWFLEAGLITLSYDHSHLDSIDRALAEHLESARAAMPGPRVGDFVRLPAHQRPVSRICDFSFDGTRFGLTGGGSFSLYASRAIGPDGRFLTPARLRHPEVGAGYSGGLDWEKEWRLDRLEDTGETAPGRFWFFSHGEQRAHNGVDVLLSCRVFTLKAAGAAE